MTRRGQHRAILQLRQALQFNTNLRPARNWPGISHRPGGIILRENSEGLYSGREHMEPEGVAIVEWVIRRAACEALARHVLDVAKARKARRLSELKITETTR